MTSAYRIIRNAILNKQQVTATYHGHYREMCPHTLGHKHGQEHALFYQFGGTSSSGLGPPDDWGNWRCVFVDKLVNVEARDGEWHTAPNHSQPQTCVDDIDVEVSY